MDEGKYRTFDVVFKTVSLIVVFTSAWLAWCQYHEIQERDFKRAFYDKQVETVAEVFDVLQAIDGADSEQKRKIAVERFWMLYQGRARTFLDPVMFEALSVSNEYVKACILEMIESDWMHCENFTASMSAAGFARTARRQLSVGWQSNFEDIGNDDPWMLPDKK